VEKIPATATGITYFLSCYERRVRHPDRPRLECPASGAGFVTKFAVSKDYLKKFTIQNVGGPIHNELWVPAQELDEFNDNIVGLIEVTRRF